MLCRLPPAPPCRLDARDPEAEAGVGGASSNKRSRRDGICFFIAEKRLIIEGEGAPPITPPPAPAAAADVSSLVRLGERAEDTDSTDVDRTEDVADNGLDGVCAAASVADVGGAVAAAADDSNRLPRVDLSEDAMIEVADEASFALSFSCRVAFVRRAARRHVFVINYDSKNKDHQARSRQPTLL